MKHCDFEVAMFAWLAALGAAYFEPTIGVAAVIAATLNLLHQRHMFGSDFIARVREVLAADLKAFTEKFAAMEKAVEDVKEAQVRIAGQWRGQNRP